MPSAIADTTEGLPHAFAKDIRKACDTFLDGRDPKAAKVRRESSSYGRARRSFLYHLIGELMRRQKMKRQRSMQAQRQQEFRVRQKRKVGTPFWG